jgi:DNA recombination protein RmuC
MVGLAYLILGAAFGALCVWLLYRERLRNATEQGKRESELELATTRERLQGAQNEVQQLAGRLEQERTQVQTLRIELEGSRNDRAALLERVGRIPGLEEEIRGYAGQVDILQRDRLTLSNQLSEKNQALEGLLAQFTELQSRFEIVERERSQFRGAKDQLQVKVTELNTTLQAERAQTGEKLALLAGAREDLVAQFQNLASKILEDKSQRFTELNRQNLEGLLRPLGEKIQEFRVKVESTYDKDSKERLTLQEEIRRLAQLNEKMSQDAINLTQALKGDSKTQGTWGEIVLERILETSGLRKNEEYIVQGRLEDGEGARLQPDIVVNLPEKRHIVIDSKVSLTAYDRYNAAEDDAERELALRQHLTSVRSHIDELGEKNYQNLYAIKSLDFVLMFIPVEPAYLVAVQSDREMFLDALRRNVLIVSPSNLIAILRTVAYIWRQENQNRNALEIARQCASLYDKFVGFVEDLEDIGRKLGAAQKSFEEAKGKLVTGRGNLIGQAERVRALGVKPTKELPRGLVEQAMDDAKTDLEGGSSPEGESNKVVRLESERKP